MGKIIPFRQEEDQLPPGVCPCMGQGTEWMIFDDQYSEVFGINGKDGAIVIDHPSVGLIGIHIEYCPYCGRKFNHEEDQDGKD